MMQKPQLQAKSITAWKKFSAKGFVIGLYVKSRKSRQVPDNLNTQ